jgi:hypothetical protein
MINLGIISQVCSQNKIIWTATSTPVSYVLKDSQETDADFDAFGQDAADQWKGTSFTAGSSYTLNRISAKIYRAGSAAYIISSYLYSDSVGIPGTLLATSTTTKTHSDLQISGAFEDFNFSGTALTNGTKYHIVFKQDTVDASNFCRWRQNTYGGTTGQNTSRSSDGSSWFAYQTNTQHDYKTYALE